MGQRAAYTFLFHFLNLLCCQVICKPTSKVIEFDVDGGKRDIFDINEEAGLDLFEGDILYDEKQGRNSILGDEYRWPRTIPYYFEDDLEFDVDGGKRDIFDINEEAGLDLFEGDILYDEKQGRNSILGDEYRWPRTIPYYFEDDLEINAKGVILKAFEQYRLKTCINYSPWAGENNYISVFKGGGCFSSVGNRRVGKQRLSIGAGCDRIATIEHEFLHALGFWHEQSRSDRDDYVTIMWDIILDGRENNFNTYNDTTSSALNVPYDYGSMMHYSKNAFRNGTQPTIVTKIPDFMDVIGQRMEFSDNDLLKLNRLYNCTRSSTFLDHCDFERENICGMIQGPGDQADWVRVAKATNGPSTDYTNMGRCDGKGYFMHFSTASGSPGDKAFLESRLLYPKRGYQCLQFFSYNSGHASDQLKIWVREYDRANPNGMLRLIQQINAPPQDLWQLHHVSVNVYTKFRVVFEGTKGSGGTSTGGLSLDDVNLSETTCPEHVWRVKNFSSVLENTPVGEAIYSPRFRSKEGYTFQMGLYPNGNVDYPNELGAYAHLVSGEDGEDAGLTWPCPWKQMTMMLMDQNADIRRRMSNQRSVTTDPKVVLEEGSAMFYWDDPRKVGMNVAEADGTRYFRGPGAGTPVYLTQARARSRDFIKGGDAIFLLTMEDVSHLVATAPPSHPCDTVKCENEGVCVIGDAGDAVCRCAAGDNWWHWGDKCQFKGSTQDSLITAVIASVSVLAAMLIVTAVSVVCVKKKYQQRKTTEHGADVVTRNTSL